MKVIDQICDRVAVIDQSCIAEEGKVSDVFTNPQSEIARELIIPQDRAALDTTGGKSSALSSTVSTPRSRLSPSSCLSVRLR